MNEKILETKDILVKTINAAINEGVSYTILEMMIRDIHNQVAESAKIEHQMWLQQKDGTEDASVEESEITSELEEKVEE